MNARNVPSIIEAIGFCSINGTHCDFLQCLVENIMQNRILKNLKMTGKLMIDNVLRHAIADSPQILRIACESGGLNQLQCFAFKEFLNLMDIMDPDSDHEGDEPREKRSPSLTEKSKNETATVSNKVSIPNTSVYRVNESESNFHDDYYDLIQNNKTDEHPTGTYQSRNCTDLLRSVPSVSKGAERKASTKTPKRKKGKIRTFV